MVRIAMVPLFVATLSTLFAPSRISLLRADDNTCQTYSYGSTSTWGGDDCETVHSVVLLSAGGYAVCGGFQELTDVDPTDGVDLRQSLGLSDVFVSRFDADGNYLWTVTLGGDMADCAYDVAETSAGGLVVVGAFWNTVDFDPTDAVYEVGSYGADDAFILSLDGGGAFQGVTTLGGTGPDGALELVYFETGEIVVAGNFHATIDLDPSPDGVQEHSTNGSNDVFVLSLDSAYQFRWGFTFGGIYTDYPRDMFQLGSEEVILVGFYEEEVDFDPGPAKEEHSAAGSCDGYVTAYDIAGDYLWTVTMGGTGYDVVRAGGVASSGDIVAAGTFENEVDFDPGGTGDIRSSAGLADLFVTALNSNGSYLWTWTAGDDGFEDAIAVATSAMGDVFVTGDFRGPSDEPGYALDFNPQGAGDIHVSNGKADIFVTRLTNDGSYGWTATTGGILEDLGWAVAADNAGNVVIGGTFGDTVDFDPTASEDVHRSEGSGDAFVTTLTCAPSRCEGDVNTDNIVDPLDSGYVLARFGCSVGIGDPLCDAADANLDLAVDPLDVGFILSRFGICP